MQRKTRRWLAGLAAVAILTPGYSAQQADRPAAAAPPPAGFTITEPVPGGFATWGELFTLQNQMNLSLERIRARATESGADGYASAIAAPENRQVILYWHGNLPAAVRQVIAEESRSFPIKVLSAPYTAKALERDAARLVKRPEFVEVAIKPDATGVIAKHDKATALSAEAAAALSAVETSAAVGEGAKALPATGRFDPTGAVYGGAYFLDYEGPCSVGFTIHQGAQTKLLTAGHCSENGRTVKYADKYTAMGAIVGKRSYLDVALIDAFGLGYIWDGPVATTTAKAVQGATWSELGNWLCQSGYASGVRCGIRVTELSYISRTDSYPNGVPVIVAERADHQNAMGQGDSGGPVFEIPNPDNGMVIAKGINSAIDAANTKVACTGSDWATRVCAWRMYYTDVKRALNDYSATISTSRVTTRHTLHNGQSAKCLAIAGGSSELSAPAIQYDCLTGSFGQGWYIEPNPSAPGWNWLKNSSGKCLAIGSSSTEPGAAAIQWTCSPSSPGQRWKFDYVTSANFGWGVKVVNGSNQCLTIANGSTANSAKAVQWPCLSASWSQQWAIQAH